MSSQRFLGTKKNTNYIKKNSDKLYYIKIKNYYLSVVTNRLVTSQSKSERRYLTYLMKNERNT